MTTTFRAQQSFAFGDDDGSLTAHSLDTVDQNRTAQQTGTANKFLVRIVVEETNNKNDVVAAGLYYSYDGGAYTDISGSSTHVRATASSYWSDDDAVTTGRLGYTGTFVSGYADSDGTDTSGVGIQSEYTEFVFCVYLVDANVVNGKNIDFRLRDAGSEIDAYNSVPRVTVSKPVVLVKQDGSHTHASTNPSLTVKTILAPQDGSHSHQTPNTRFPSTDVEGWYSVLAPTGRRSIVARSSRRLIGTPSVGAETLSPQNGSHTHASANPALTQAHTLTKQDGSHTHISSNPSLGQAYALVLQDGSHTHISTSPTLTQDHQIIVQAGAHTHISENPNLSGMTFPWSDGFETGDTTEWDGSSGTVTINGTAAIVGSYGMELDTSNAEYVYKQWVNSSHQTYRVKFRINTNNLTASASDQARIVMLYDDLQFCGAIEMIWSVSSFNLRTVMRNDAGVPSAGSLNSISTNTDYLVEVEWVFQDTSGYSNMWIDGSPVNGLSGVDTGTRIPDEVRFGQVAVASAFDSGTYHLDDFTIYDTLRPIALVPQNGSHTHSSTNPVLVRNIALSSQDGSHGHASENPALTQAHGLSVQDGAHVHSSESPDLTQTYILVIQDGAHSHASGALNIFSFPWLDGFETGDTSRWTSGVSSPVINGTAAIDGSYGMFVAYDDAQTYTRLDWTNTTEQIYRVKFKLDDNLVGTTGAQTLQVLRLDDSGAANGVGLIQVRNEGATRTLQSYMKKNDASNSVIVYYGLSGQVTVEAEYNNGSGTHKLWVNGGLVSSDSGFSADNYYPDSARLGMLSGSASFDSGSLYLDSFELHNTLRPLLVLQDGSHSHASENPALTQVHSLAVQDGSHAHASTSPALDQTLDLVPLDGSHTHQSENPTFQQSHNLTVQDGSHTHASENPVLVYLVLVPQDSSHTHISENPVLVRNIDLVPQDSTHAHASDNPALTQQQTLNVQDGQHAHTSSSPSLTQDHILITQDGSHTHVSQNPGLSGESTLSVQDGAHTHISQNPLLTQYHTLDMQDGAHTHISENPDLAVTQYMDVLDGSHTHVSPVFAITQTHSLIMQDGAHTHIASAPTVSVTHNIEMQDGSHTHTSENVDLTEIEWFSPKIVAPMRSRQIPIRQLRL